MKTLLVLAALLASACGFTPLDPCLPRPDGMPLYWTSPNDSVFGPALTQFTFAQGGTVLWYGDPTAECVFANVEINGEPYGRFVGSVWLQGNAGGVWLPSNAPVFSGVLYGGGDAVGQVYAPWGGP